MKNLIIIVLVFLPIFSTFSQKIIFQLQEKRTHYTDFDGNDIDLIDITEETNSTLTFNLKDSTVSLQKNGETTITKLSKIEKKGSEYSFESKSQYAIDPSKTVITYYVIDCKKHIGSETYSSFCMNNTNHVTDFKGKAIIR
jgi:hypothetical protein